MEETDSPKSPLVKVCELWPSRGGKSLAGDAGSVSVLILKKPKRDRRPVRAIHRKAGSAERSAQGEGMSQVAELELPFELVSRSETEMVLKIPVAFVWPWIQKLIARRFLITVNPNGIDAVRADQRVRLKVGTNGEGL